MKKSVACKPATRDRAGKKNFVRTLPSTESNEIPRWLAGLCKPSTADVGAAATNLCGDVMPQGVRTLIPFVGAFLFLPICAASASTCLSPNGSSGQEVGINNLLSKGGAGTVVSLCPSTVFNLSHPVVFTAGSQEISTENYPTGQTRATLVVTGSSQSIAIDGQCADCSKIVLRNIQVNGNRPSLGVLSNGSALIEIGGEVSDQLIEYVHSFEPRGWSALHVFEGALDCSGVSVLNNDIGPSGEPNGQWADGISYACRRGLVANNVVTDATDGGIVVFQAPGTVVEKNTIIAQTRALLGGINMVDYAPYDGNYTDTIVTKNLIESDGAMIKVGIAMGPAVWGTDTTDTNTGATVTGNQIRGKNLGYAMAVNGVSNFTVEGNVAVGEFTGRPPSYNPPAQPFLMNPTRAGGHFSGQHFAYADAFQYLIGIVDAFPSRSTFPASAFLLTGETGILNSAPLMLWMNGTNDLVLYSVAKNGGTTPLWSSRTAGVKCAQNGTACGSTFQQDGSLVVYDGTGKILWSTNTNKPGDPGSDFLFSSQEPYLEIVDAKKDVLWTENDAFSRGHMTLKSGQFAQIESQTGHPFFLTMQGDGDLVMYEGAEHSGPVSRVWASNTAGQSCAEGCKAVFQRDGNFVLSDGARQFWATNTNLLAGAGTMLSLSSKQPYVKILDEAGNSVWESR